MPQQIGPFAVLERLGAGAMASVYRARLERATGGPVTVSLKILHEHLAGDHRVVREFAHEARVAHLLSHPNIGRCYRAGRVGPDYFIASEYIEGTDLGRLLERARRLGAPPPIDASLSILVQLCSALSYAHRLCDDNGRELGFVHRDVSPSNLIVRPDGVVKLIDMGIAKSAGRRFRTETGVVKGKPAYLAPEVAIGGRVEPGADIFSIGVVAWELLSGQRLFGGRSEIDTLERVQRGARVPPSQHNAACPPQLDAIVMRAIDPRPERRWRSAGSFGRALAAAAAQLRTSTDARAVAAWVQSLDAAEAARANAWSDDDATTEVHDREASPARIARAAHAASVPAPGDVTAPTVRLEPGLVRTPSRVRVLKRRAWVMSLVLALAASLAVNLVLLIHAVGAAEPAPPPAAPAVAVEPIATAMPDEVPPCPETAPAPVKAAAPVKVAPVALAKVAPAKAVVTLEPIAVRHPRSRSSQAAYAARVCIDERGRVASVEVFEGPRRLYRRIARNLRRWRFPPPADASAPVCTVVRDRLRKR